MIEIANQRFYKYWLFGSLYFSEGLLKAIAVVIIPIYFLEKGLSPEVITLVIGIGGIPMIIKFFWGGITDYFIRFGRKRFIILGGLLSILGLMMLTFIDPKNELIVFTIFSFLSWCGVGFLDVSADAWAIEISKENERGKINGAMYSGQNIGLASGAVALPFLSQLFGYTAVFSVGSAIMSVILIFPLVVHDIKIVKIRQKVGSLLLSEFKKKTVMLVAIFAVLIAVPSGLLLIIAPLYMNMSLSLDITQIGLITMVFTIATACGSLIGGALADRWGRKLTLYAFIGLSIVFTALLILSTNWQNFLFLYSVIGFLQGGYIAVFLALSMDVTNPCIGATQFSIFTGLGNFGLLGLEALSGTLFMLLGFSRLFLYSAWACGPALIILYAIRLTSQKNYH